MLELLGAAGKQLAGKMHKKSKYSEKTAKTEVSAAALFEDSTERACQVDECKIFDQYRKRLTKMLKRTRKVAVFLKV